LFAVCGCSVSFVLCDLSVFPLCFSVCPLFLGSSCFCFFFVSVFPPCSTFLLCSLLCVCVYCISTCFSVFFCNVLFYFFCRFRVMAFF
jgi:hypothetical protein